MNTYHIHISGLVQGVGFRPFVCRIAEQMGINGWVNNGNDGVHIEFNAAEETANDFYTAIISNPPPNAVIRSYLLRITRSKKYAGFCIQPSDASAKPDLLLTPDIAICGSCKNEINDAGNKRFQYPFTTCLQCGPRYSIITALPYDRENTTMNELEMCDDCKAEFNSIHDHRHYSQTNSCPQCSIPVHLYNNDGAKISSDFDSVLILAQQALKDGHIIAVKGIGGYLLLCDATRPLSIETLRDRKHRPAKPFAVMYPSIEMIEQDLVLHEKEINTLTGKTAPIVLCRLKDKPLTGLSSDVIAPGLDKIGALLPYTPLLVLLMQQWNKPLIATSGNLSGSPIIYKDEDALLWLTDYADFIISFERDIVTPQDDSVLQFTQQQQIILRRSRGLAPNYFPSPFTKMDDVLAMGAELKSAFALNTNHNLYVSQYLGDQANYESQVSFDGTLHHVLQLVKARPQQILIDSHPNYFVSQKGIELAGEWNIPVIKIQHHKAHFAAVLAENNLLHNEERILGVVWDGTGYGDDEQIWGGEFFMMEDGDIERYMHLDYFPQLLGDKMSKEPRVSAVSLLRNNMEQLMMLKDLFSETEREYYLKLLQQQQPLLTSSMGRLLDGIAALLKIQSFNSYEGEAAMKLERMARECETVSFDYYPIRINKNRLEWSAMIDEIINDVKINTDTAVIARKVFVSLAMLVKNVAIRAGVKKIAFSGGVFQNVLLVDMITALLQNDAALFFHQQLSPNDECIGFGQIAFAAMNSSKNAVLNKRLELLTN